MNKTEFEKLYTDAELMLTQKGLGPTAVAKLEEELGNFNEAQKTRAKKLIAIGREREAGDPPGSVGNAE